MKKLTVIADGIFGEGDDPMVIAPEKEGMIFNSESSRKKTYTFPKLEDEETMDVVSHFMKAVSNDVPWFWTVETHYECAHDIATLTLQKYIA